MNTRILFVCLGNICRSPAAEGIFRDIAPDCETDSAATAGWHVGNAPYAPMQAAMRARGIDISGQRTRQICDEDFKAFDLIAVMDAENLADVENVRPEGGTAKVCLFTSFLEGLEAEPVPDPYYTRDFDGCLDLIEEAAWALKTALEQGRV
jgi:protein-tyrosine phosphatase